MKKMVLGLITFIGLFGASLQAQPNTENYRSVAIISVDASGIALDNIAMANLIRFELEKIEL